MPRLTHIRPAAIAALLIAIGAIRMATTFRVFSATADEATHIGGGLELFEYHRYWLLPENPPPPRIILTAAPWFGGMRLNPHGTFSDQIHSVFYDHGEYRANLVRARLGTIVFFVIAALALFVTARDAIGEKGALITLFLFTMEPVVLGYSALATHDGPALAGLTVALLAFTRWLRTPDLRRALIFGAAFGFAIDCKFSSIVFVPACCVAIAIIRLMHDVSLRRQLARVATMIPAALVTLFVIWAGYGFTVGKAARLTPFQDGFGPSTQRLLARLGPDAPIPAPDFFIGIAKLLQIDKHGFLTYLCGKSGTTGWWWYFPFAIAVKTTIAALLLFIAGAWFAIRSREERWAFVEWSAAALAIIVFSMPTALDLGIRYLLPFYVPFAIAGGAAALATMRAPRVARALAIALLVCHLGASAMAHPDYFPYFNAFAGRDPSRYLIDSNLDWGQDVLRLRSVLRHEHATSLAQSLMGPADFAALGFPPVRPASPWAASHGWVAVSDHSYRMTGGDGGWKWLPDNYQRVGKSIRLYRIP